MANKLIFFDLDGTLSPQKTWFTFNTHFGLTPEEDKALFLDYISNAHDYQTWIEKLSELLKTRGLCTKDSVAAFADNVELRPDAISLIEACKEKGYIPVIISGSIKQITDTIAKKLGIDIVFSGSDIVFNEDGTLHQIFNIGDEAIAKLQIFKEVCKEYSVDPTETIMVGDGGNDLEVFKESKKAILLGEYEPLKPHAWKQISNLKEIIDLI